MVTIEKSEHVEETEDLLKMLINVCPDSVSVTL